MEVRFEEVAIELLNHGAVVLRGGGVGLLCDPWFSGTCFDGGWGLAYDNPDALDAAAACSHLWISHFHGDHLHPPTLAALAARNPGMTALANASYNFDTGGPLRRAEFRKVQVLPERRALRIAPEVELYRQPATGIDNMLLVRMGTFSILNYNDCNLPAAALRRLLRELGPIDVLLCNFNHAGKLVVASHDARAVREQQRRNFETLVSLVSPKYVIPFASMHRYRAEASLEQNESLLSAEEVASSVPSALPLYFGDIATFGPGGVEVRRREPTLRPMELVPLQYGPSRSWEELAAAAKRRRRRLRSEFGVLTSLLPPLVVEVEDLGKRLRLDWSRGASECLESPHIACHSEPLLHWLDHPYGAVDFQVGGHYRICAADTLALRRTLLACGLSENHLTPRHFLRMLFARAGWRFFWNRREEIFALVLGGRFSIESRL
jgi:hypothetical protein